MKKLVFLIVIILTVSYYNVLTVSAFDGAEVFDIQKGGVVKTIKNSASLQTEVQKWLSSIAGPVISLNIEPENGIGLKIDITPPYKIKNQWIKGTVTKVILFVSQTDTYYPTLVIFTKENSLIAVYMNYDLKPFLKTNNLYHPEFNLNSPQEDSKELNWQHIIRKT